MRYFKVKPAYEVTVINDQKVKIDYKEMLLGLCISPAQLTQEQFMRATALFTQIKNFDGDIIDIDDADYAILQLKIPGYINSFTPMAIAVPDIANFIQEFNSAPTSK